MIGDLPPRKKLLHPEQDEAKLKNEAIKTSNFVGAIMVCWFIALLLFFAYLATMMLLNEKFTTEIYGFYLTFPAAFALYYLYLAYLKYKNRKNYNPNEICQPAVSIASKLFSLCATLGFILFFIMGCVIQYTFGLENIHNLVKFSQYQKTPGEVISSKTEITALNRVHDIIKVRFQFNNKQYEPTLKREYIFLRRHSLQRPKFVPGEMMSVYVNPQNVPDYIFIGKIDYFGRLIYDFAPVIFIIIGLTGIGYKIKKRGQNGL
ncbi:MAG: DUF3592 domain-containing protein [Candidatus Berkiella sp.]